MSPAGVQVGRPRQRHAGAGPPPAQRALGRAGAGRRRRGAAEPAAPVPGVPPLRHVVVSIAPWLLLPVLVLSITHADILNTRMQKLTPEYHW